MPRPRIRRPCRTRLQRRSASTEDVTCHVTLLGGGFGRKSKPDYVAEAALLSKQVGKPVKVVWSREDDLQFDYFHSPAGMYMKAAVDERDKPTAWLQRSVFPPIASQNNPDEEYGGFQLGMGWMTSLTRSRIFAPKTAARGARPHRLDALGVEIYHAFGVQSFTDELAAAANRDRVEYLLELSAAARDRSRQEGMNSHRGNPKFPFDTGRLRNVIELVAEKSGWAKKKPGAGRALGIAAHRSFLTYVAAVVEVEVDPQATSDPARVMSRSTPGTVINPDRVRRSSKALPCSDEPRADRRNDGHRRTNPTIELQRLPGRAHQAGALRTNVHIVNSDAPPAGVGEPVCRPWLRPSATRSSRPPASGFGIYRCETARLTINPPVRTKNRRPGGDWQRAACHRTSRSSARLSKAGSSESSKAAFRPVASTAKNAPLSSPTNTRPLAVVSVPPHEDRRPPAAFPTRSSRS